jgi:hypothetical protein
MADFHACDRARPPVTRTASCKVIGPAIQHVCLCRSAHVAFAGRQARHSRIRTHGAISAITHSSRCWQLSQIPSCSVAIGSPPIQVPSYSDG